MREPSPSTLLDTTVLAAAIGGTSSGDARPGAPTDNAGTPVPANRAARRGRAGKQTPSGAVHASSRGRARAAQGRRINPVRRTG